MALLIRTVLIWLLALAIPAQGAVAATMALCGPNHNAGEPATQAARSGAIDRAHHGLSAKLAHGHEGVEAGLSDTGEASVSAKVGHADKHKCSACASCCSMGGILSTGLGMPDAEAAPTVFAASVATVDAFATDGPDRPPRIVLA